MHDQPLKEAIEEKNIQLLAQETFYLEGDYHRLVTFLNQSLKQRGLIFGLSKRDDEGLCLRIYDTLDESHG